VSAADGGVVPMVITSDAAVVAQSEHPGIGSAEIEVLKISTYLWESRDDEIRDVAVDSKGNVYVAGGDGFARLSDDRWSGVR